MSRPPLAAVAALAAVSLALAGCGSTPSDAEQITALTRGFAADAKQHDWKGVCGAMSTKARMQIALAGAFLGGGDCAATMKKFLTLGADESGLGKISPDAIKVTAIRVTGDRATAKVSPAPGGDPVTTYVREDGDWRIDADGGSSSGGAKVTIGDGGSKPAGPRLAVAESGFSPTGDSTSYGLVVRNPSGQDAKDVRVQVNLVGAGGHVLATENHELAGIPAGSTAAVGGDSDTDGEHVRRLEITATADSGERAGSVLLPAVSDARVVPDDFGLSVRAEVRNTLAQPLSMMSDVYAVLRDGRGRVVGGMSSFLQQNLQPGGRAAVKLTTFDEVRGAAAADVTVDGETA